MKNVIVITGGAGGMGLAAAKILGQQKYQIVISDVSQENLNTATKELNELNISAKPVICDITDRSAVDRLVQVATSEGRVVGVVHAAGVSPQMGHADFIIKINAVGTINVAEAFLAIADEKFSLINVASVAGHMLPKFLIPKRIFNLVFKNKDKFYKKLLSRARRSPKKMRPGQAYSLSKSFVIWYSAKIAAKFGELGARVVSVSPGSFDTKMGQLEKKSGSGMLIDYAALKRFGRPEEVAELLAFLASGKAFYITGTDILIDGGVKANITPMSMIKMALDSKKNR